MGNSSDEDYSSIDEYDLDTSSSTATEEEEYVLEEAPSDSLPYNETILQNVVIDPGSSIFKAGFAGEEYPPICIPNIVGTPKIFNEADWKEMRERIYQKNIDPTLDLQNNLKIGQDAVDNMMDLQLFYPVKRGRIEHFHEFETIMELVFINHLKVDPEHCNVLISEPPMHSQHSREKLGEIMFEILRVNAMKTMNDSVLSLFSSGRTTGLMVTSGDQVSHVTPIYDGYIIEHGIRRINLGGRDVTHYLQRIMLERGYDFNSSAEHLIAGQIKESLGFVSTDFASDMDTSESEFEKNYELPDGSEITLGKERFRAPEILFDPMIIGKEMDGISQMVYNSYSTCPIDVKETLRKTVILGGGTTLYTGFATRLSSDLQKIDTTYRPFKVIAPEIRQFSSWMGGSVYASLSTFGEQVIYLEEYEEEGPRILHKSNFT